MLFHKFLTMAEKYLPHAARRIRTAAVFRLDAAPHKVLDKTWPEDKRQRLLAHFKLPYPVIAIEDQASCVVLADPSQYTRGLRATRCYIECVGTDPMSDSAAFSDNIDDKALTQEIIDELPPGTVMVHLGHISCPEVRETGFGVTGDLAGIIAGTPEHLAFAMRYLDSDHPLVMQMLGAALKNAMTAIEEVIMVQDQPGFAGWPTDEHALRNNIFDITTDGRIIVNDQYERQPS